MRVIKYDTGIENFYLVVSHKKSGASCVSYILVNNDDSVIIEVIPEYGPLTILRAENVVDSYLNLKIKDRGDWAQQGFEDCEFNRLLHEGNLKEVASRMERWL